MVRILTRCMLLFIGAITLSCSSNSMDELMVGEMQVEGDLYEVYLLGSDSLSTSGFFTYKRIELRENKNATPQFVIDSLNHQGWGVGASFEDRNFDGYSDIAILLDDPGYQWNPHSLWLFDPVLKKFTYSSFMEYLPHEAYWIKERNLVMISNFDRGETYTDTFYSFEKGDYEVVREEITVDGSLTMGLSVTTVSERKNGKMRVTSTTSQAGGLKLKKSASITDKEEIKSFLEMLGDGTSFNKLIKKGKTFERYHDSCETAGFSLELDADEEWEGFSELFYPTVTWEAMYEGPEEQYSIEKINYHSNGNSFTLFMKYIEVVYEEDSEPSYKLYDEIESMSFSYNKDILSWIVRYSEYEDAHYALTDRAENLPMNDSECEGFGEDY